MALWEEGSLAPDLIALLDCRDTLVEIAHGEPGVVLGVPHHAARGVDRIAERRPEGGRVADENAVVYALICFDALRVRGVGCRLMVAAHATDHDPNKHPESPYCRAALDSPATRLLVECHGAGARAPNELELSAGRNRLADPLAFGRRLVRSLGAGFRLAAQSEPAGDRALVLDADGNETPGVLRFPALLTRSLELAGSRNVAALHLEAKPRFRLTSAGAGFHAPTPSGDRLGIALADAIEDQLEAAATGSP